MRNSQTIEISVGNIAATKKSGFYYSSKKGQMMIKWQSAVPAVPFPPPSLLLCIPFLSKQPEHNSSAQNMSMALNALRLKVTVLLVTYKILCQQPDLISRHFSLLVLTHGCSSDKQNLPFHQGLCIRASLFLEVLLPDLQVACL